MIHIRPSGARHHEQFGWLDTKWSFSFATYYDPAHTAFGPLRVLNEDVIQPGTGFPLHAHGDMEIVTFVLEGAVRHRDSLGNETVIRAGEVQRMTAGTGIRHSEHNPSPTEPLHLLQVWIIPERKSLPPSYEQRAFSLEQRSGLLQPVVSGKSEGGALLIHQDVTVYRSHLDAGRGVAHRLSSDRQAYLFLISGGLRINGSSLKDGDAALVTGETGLAIAADRASEVLLFDLPVG